MTNVDCWCLRVVNGVRPWRPNTPEVKRRTEEIMVELKNPKKVDAEDDGALFIRGGDSLSCRFHPSDGRVMGDGRRIDTIPIPDRAKALSL